MTALTAYQAKYYAHELQRSYANDHVGKLAGLLFDAQVEPKPHQIDAALVRAADPVSAGRDPCGRSWPRKDDRGRASSSSQYWAERKRNILIIAPSSLRQQWQQELHEKFLIPSSLLDPKTKDAHLARAGVQCAEVLICSYEFALRHETSLLRGWDLVVADEAHRLRSYWNGKAKVAEAVAHIVANANKTVLLTATPLQNRLEELYGLVSVFDPSYFYSLDAFRERYIKARDLGGDDDLVERVAAISKRTLRRDADKYIRFTKRHAADGRVHAIAGRDASSTTWSTHYLQRDELHAFAGSQRHLSALIIRKRLGSSTYAVASTLENIANRLAARARERPAPRRPWRSGGRRRPPR